jgi:hypothetical protein
MRCTKLFKICGQEHFGYKGYPLGQFCGRYSTLSRQYRRRMLVVGFFYCVLWFEKFNYLN